MARLCSCRTAHVWSSAGLWPAAGMVLFFTSEAPPNVMATILPGRFPGRGNLDFFRRSSIRMSAPELHFKASSRPSRISSTASSPSATTLMVVDETTRSTVQDTLWTTVYGYRHDPKNPIDAPGSLQKLTDLFYSKYSLKDEALHEDALQRLSARSSNTTETCSRLRPCYRANNLQSQMFSMNDVLSRDDDGCSGWRLPDSG